MKSHSGDLMEVGDQALSPRCISDGEPPNPVPWPDPTPEMLASPRFEAVWQCIKRWDINVPQAYAGYSGATGNHVRAILDALSVLAEGSDVYRDQALYTDGYKIGYAQAVADADLVLRKHGDDRQTRICRRDVLALAKVAYEPDEAMPRPDWSKHYVSGPGPYTPPESHAHAE